MRLKTSQRLAPRLFFIPHPGQSVTAGLAPFYPPKWTSFPPPLTGELDVLPAHLRAAGLSNSEHE